MKWLTRLTIAAVFVLGAVAGTVIGMKLERERFLRMQRSGPVTLTEQALKYVSSEVKLQPNQYQQLREVLTKVQPLLTAAENERRRQVLEIMESVRTSTLAFLDSGQQKAYNVLHDRMKGKLRPLAPAAAATAAAVFGL